MSKGNGLTAVLLEQWGIWARHSIHRDIGYRSQILQIIKDNVEQPGRRYLVSITDDLALSLDAAVCALAGRHLLCSQVLFSVFVERRSFIDTAEKLGITRKEASAYFDKAVSWIDGYLDGRQDDVKAA